MEQLVYISTPRTVLTETDLHQILEVSRRNNRRDGLTGLLLAGDKRLLQVLEGPTQALSDAFDHIRHDARHFAVVVLWRTPISERAFPDWSMGFERYDIIAGDQSLVEFLNEHSKAIKDRNLLAELQGFARLNSKAA
jgi:hypothetical protein